MFEKELKERLECLEKALRKVNRELEFVPEGNLRISKCHGRSQYYRVLESGDNLGDYIRRKDEKLAYELAQKDYNYKLKEEIEKETDAIEQYLNSQMKINPDAIYSNLSENRQALITPHLITNEEYAKIWQATPYEGKAFAPSDPDGLYTDRGERVRSKSEIFIANKLARLGVPYKYECPVRLAGYRDVYADFTLLCVPKREERYFEHFGKMDEPGYLQGFFWKQSQYARNGIVMGKNLYATFETKEHPLNTKDLEIIVENIAKECL